MARRGYKIHETLRTLKKSAKTIAQIIDALVPSTSKYSYRHSWTTMRVNAGSGPNLEVRNKQETYRLISKLRKQGLIDQKNNQYYLTKKGRDKFTSLKKALSRIIPKRQYTAIPSNEIVIISFDIPERDRYKRDWLRSVLTNLKMKMHHESLWIGKHGVPKEFISDITEQGLTDHVAIFAVTKRGSLKELV